MAAANIAPIYDGNVNPDFCIKSEIIEPNPIAINKKDAPVINFFKHNIFVFSSL